MIYLLNVSFKRISHLLAIIILLFCTYSSRNVHAHIKQAADVSASTILLDNQYVIIVNFHLNNEWKIYSTHPGDTGMPPSIELLRKNKMDKVFINEVIWPQANKYEEDVSGEVVTSYVYDKDFSIIVKIGKEEYTATQDLSIIVKYAACNVICAVFEHKIDVALPSNHANTQAAGKIDVLEICLIMLGAMLGGFILNFMPCVFPVLSIKLFGIIKHSKKEHKVITMNLLCNAIGIILTFLIMAIITILFKSGGKLIGWGIHFQSPIFLIVLIIIMALVASNLWGDFEVKLPSFINNKFGLIEINNEYLGSVFSGVLATILATPCTAPFLATSLAFALSQNFLMILLTYLCIGLGMAIPYAALSMKPALLSKLPKPGNWMEHTKKIMACFVLLTILWLFYILSYHFNLQSIVALCFGLFVFRVVLIKSHYFKATIRYVVLTSVILAFSLLSYCVNDNAKDDQNIDAIWENFDADKLQRYVNNGQTVLIDVTASWCVTCKVNKIMILDNKDVINMLKKKNVLLMRADYTHSNHEISKFLVTHSQHGIPLNVIYGPKNLTGLKLPIVLTQDILFEGIASVQ